MKIANIFLPASVLLLSGDTVAAGRRRPKGKGGKSGKGGKGSKGTTTTTTTAATTSSTTTTTAATTTSTTAPTTAATTTTAPTTAATTAATIGEPEVFYGGYDFITTDAPESIVFDSKGIAYVSLSNNGIVSVLDPEGNEIRRIELPMGYCRPEIAQDIKFPTDALQFGLAMSKDDVLFVSLQACAEGFPQPPNPNPDTGLWMINTEDYSMKQIARVPNADGRGRQEFCCEWNEYYWKDGGDWGPWDSSFGKNDDGTCDLETCAFYEAWYGSIGFGSTQFRGYAEIWNGIEVVGDCVYVTNSYFNDIQRACPTDDEDAMWRVDTWMERGAIGTNPLLQRAKGTQFVNAGLNGIKYFDGAFYIANTAGRRIVKVPLLPADSSSESNSIESVIRNTGGEGIIPGTPELVWEGGDVDEFTLDAKGNIYAALFNDNKVIKISLDGTATTLLEGGPAYNWFAIGCQAPGFTVPDEYYAIPEIDMPSSVGFGVGPAGDMTLYVASAAFVFFKSCSGDPTPGWGPEGYLAAYPGISRIFVGEKGAEQMW